MKFQNNRIPKYTKSLITSEHTSFLLSIALRHYVLIKKQLQLLTTSQQSNSSHQSLLSSTRRTSEDSIASNNLSDSSRIIYSSIARSYLSIPPFTSWKITFVRIAFILLVNYLHLTHQYSSTLNFSLPGK